MEAIRRFFDGDVFFSFKHSPLTAVATLRLSRKEQRPATISTASPTGR